MKVKDCMCNDVCCVNPNTTVKEVAKLMGENHIGCIPVCNDNNCICGIVTDRDVLLRCVACDKETNQTPVSEIMSLNVCSCKENDDMTTAEGLMGENQIRRLPVCDENNHVIGILSIGDLAQNDGELGKGQVCTTISNICNCDNQSKNAE